ncbi:hypothetical protein SAMN05518800_1869 [Variovorax sp. YR752]|nr:hypothetical protein SAMN05518800_1869 [Variovorax sp. YR752]
MLAVRVHDGCPDREVAELGQKSAKPSERMTVQFAVRSSLRGKHQQMPYRCHGAVDQFNERIQFARKVLYALPVGGFKVDGAIHHRQAGQQVQDSAHRVVRLWSVQRVLHG